MVVLSNTTWTGRVVAVLAPPMHDEAAIRVAWDGDGETIVPLSACSPVGDQVMVQFATEDDSQTGKQPTAMVMDRDAFTVPIIEEEVTAQAVWRDSGEVTIRLRTEDVPQTLTAQVAREEVTVEQVDLNRPLDASEEVSPRQEGDCWIIPVVIEEAVIVKRRVLSHELHITKRTVTATQTVETTTRHTRPEIDGGALADRTHIAPGIARDGHAADGDTSMSDTMSTNTRSTQ